MKVKSLVESQVYFPRTQSRELERIAWADAKRHTWHRSELVLGVVSVLMAIGFIYNVAILLFGNH